MPSKFITLEGLDGSGLTTQARDLEHWINFQGKIRIKYTKEPSDGPVGSLIKKALQDEAVIDEATIALLFAADRLDHLAREIEPWLAAGIHVVCDRYRLSSFAYQSVHLPFAWVKSLNSRARAPDLTIVLKVPPAVCVERLTAGGMGTERYETEERLARVWANYEKIIPLLQEAGEKIEIVDGDRPKNVVQKELQEIVWPVLGISGIVLTC